MVEWKKLGEIMTIVRGASPRPITNYITNDADGVNWIKIGDVASDAKYITSSNEKITKEGAAKSRFLHSGDFILSNSMSFGRPYILKIDGCIHDGWIAMSDFEQHVSSGYLYEILNSNKVQDYWKMKANNGGAMTNLNSDIVRQTIIPIPSLSEQQRIVSILDTFTSSISNLKQQIEERRKQYNFLLDKLYYANKSELLEATERGEVCVKTLDEIGTFTRGRRFVRTDIVEEGVPCIHYGDMYTYYGVFAEKTPTFLTKEKAEKLRFAKKGDVVIVAAGENDIDIGVGVAWLGEEDVVVHDACFIFKHNMNPKYLSYFMRSMNYHLQIRMGVVDGKICSISAKELGRTLTPVPSLSEQSRIVSILDTFEQSIANLEEQLAMREKQYEYYREKLLRFEEA